MRSVSFRRACVKEALAFESVHVPQCNLNTHIEVLLSRERPSVRSLRQCPFELSPSMLVRKKAVQRPSKCERT